MEVWTCVAKWGTFRDEALGDWPSDDECFACLPKWFQDHIKQYSFRDWLIDLHDREWIWWSSSVVNNLIKVDVDAESQPISTWMLTLVVESAGGDVTYNNDWLSLEQVERLAGDIDDSEPS